MAETLPETYKEIPSLVDTDLSDPDAVKVAALRLESLLLGRPADPNEDITQALGQNMVAAANRLYERFETDLELEFADKIIKGEASVEDYLLYERFVRLIGKEVELAEIKPDERVLFIGSGPFPISPILIHELSGGAKVECFDMSEEACEVSRQVIVKLGLENEITVKNIAAESAEKATRTTPGDVGYNTKVIVALLAQPKKELIDRLVLSLAPGSTIVMRNSEGNRRAIYQGVEPSAVLSISFRERPGFDILGEYHAGEDDTISGTVMKPRYVPRVHRE